MLSPIYKSRPKVTCNSTTRDELHNYDPPMLLGPLKVLPTSHLQVQKVDTTCIAELMTDNNKSVKGYLGQTFGFQCGVKHAYVTGLCRCYKQSSVTATRHGGFALKMFVVSEINTVFIILINKNKHFF